MTDVQPAVADVQTANEVQTIKVDYEQLVDDGSNVRLTMEGVSELADSIWSAGLINPITIRKNGDGKYHLVAGFRRHAAIGLLISQGRWSGPVIALLRKDEDADSALVANIVENLQRVDINPADEAVGIQRLVIEHSFTIEDVALNLGISTGVVKDRLAIASLSELGLAAVRARALSIEAGVALSKADEKLQAKLVNKLDEYTSRPDVIRRLIKDAERGKERALLVAALKEQDIKAQRGVEYSMNRVLELEDATPAKIVSWVVANGITADDHIVIGEPGYGGKGWSVSKYVKREEREAQHEPTTYQADTAAEVFGGDDLPTEITEWYDASAKVYEEIVNGRDARDAATAKLRAQFIHDLGKADVAAAAIRYQARQIAYNIKLGISTERDREYFLTALGASLMDLTPKAVEGDPILPSPTEGSILAYISSNTKAMVRAAALSLCNRHGTGTLEPLFQESIVARGEVEALPEFPPLPPLLQAYVEASGDDAEIESLQDIDMLIEGYLAAKDQTDLDERDGDGSPDEDDEPDDDMAGEGDSDDEF